MPTNLILNDKKASDTEVYLLRHGLTNYNQEDIFQGSSDIPLNEEGRREAKKVSERLYKEVKDIDKIYVSNLIRTQETIEPLCEKLDLEPEVLNDLAEIDGGEVEGLSLEIVDTDYAEYRQVVYKYPFRVHYPHGESGEDVYKRAVRAFKHVLAENQGKTVILVTHGFLLQMLIIYLRRENPYNAKPIQIGNTALSRVLVSADGDIKIDFLNDTSHLED